MVENAVSAEGGQQRVAELIVNSAWRQATERTIRCKEGDPIIMDRYLGPTIFLKTF